MVLGEAAAPSNPSTAARKKRFDKINVELKDGVLRVEGEKRVSQMADGLGGEFTYCTLGEPLSIEKLLSGQDLPSFEALGAWLLHTATGGTLQAPPPDAPAFYLSEAQDAHVWLVYRPDLAFLKSADAALTLPRAQAMAEWGTCAAGWAGRAQAPPGVCARQVFEQCAIARAGHRVCGAAVCIVPSGVRPWHNKSVFAGAAAFRQGAGAAARGAGRADRDRHRARCADPAV
jgi:hypothetical protein